MAKQKLVAKVRFDDGTKKGENGKATDYNVGDVYQGDEKSAADLKKKGLLCAESELTASKEVLDEKDRTIRQLEDKVAKLQRTIDELQKKIDGDADDDKPKGKGKKGDASTNTPTE